MHTICALVLSVAMVAMASPAEARRYPGTWSNAFTGDIGDLRFRLRGRLRPEATTIRGRVRCRRCPVRGRLRLECTAAGPNFAECTGTLANGCTVEGFYYSTQFEGTYACSSGLVGSLSFGRR